MAGLVSRGLRTICFAKSRKAAELIHRFTADRVDTATAARLAPYRAGYTPAQRREIERRLMEGELLGVSATDALELGIDIGELDCAISVGFPGTVASLRQQWGRAGPPRTRPRRARSRARTPSTSSSCASRRRSSGAASRRRDSTTPIPAFSTRTSAPPPTRVRCTSRDAETLGPEALERAAVLPELERTPAGYVWKGRDAPAARFSLRSGDQDSFTIVDGTTGSVLGLVERGRAYSAVHEGAVYLHLGEQYLVRVARRRRAHGGRRAGPRRLVHAGQEGHGDGDRGAAAFGPRRRRRPPVRARLGHRAGRSPTSARRSATARPSTPCPCICPR